MSAPHTMTAADFTFTPPQKAEMPTATNMP